MQKENGFSGGKNDGRFTGLQFEIPELVFPLVSYLSPLKLLQILLYIYIFVFSFIDIEVTSLIFIIHTTPAGTAWVSQVDVSRITDYCKAEKENSVVKHLFLSKGTPIFFSSV